MANNNRAVLGQESVEGKERTYTSLFTSRLGNVQRPLTTKPQSGVSPVAKDEWNFTSLSDTPSTLSPQVPVGYGSRKRRIDFNEDSADHGKRKKVVPSFRYIELTREAEKYAINNKQSNILLNQKLKLRDKLLQLFRRELPQSNLFLVGSSNNGFASNGSDADFCLMLKDRREVGQEFEAHRHLRLLKNLLHDSDFAKKIEFIPAKVPILKFQDKISGCECDVNVHNLVGIRNTHLLRAYSKVDDRIHPLVLTVKRWAKARSINDASQGTLSSYTLMLMVLHFLQSACSPPVLKPLQEEYPGLFNQSKPVNELEMSEPGNQIACNSSQNQESVGELLEQFFQYYANFSYSTQGINVRSVRVIPKHWRARYIYVEEPFDLTNTARAVRHDYKFALIKDEFKRAAKRLNKRLSVDNIL